jgi:RNA polymerase sigma factor for flagellar operon FliA
MIAAKAAQQSIDKTLLQYRELVHRIAYHLRSGLPKSIQVEDLIQSGMIGLLEAIKRFNPNKGAQFETFANIRIRGAMLDEIRKSGWLPRSAYQDAKKTAHILEKTAPAANAPLSAEALCVELNISFEKYKKLLKSNGPYKILSLEDYHLEAEASNPDHLAHETVFEDVEAFFLQESLLKQIKKLSLREQEIMHLYYESDLNFREIGAQLEISESRVCQIHHQAIQHLKINMDCWKN